jgi:hypothetical protein
MIFFISISPKIRNCTLLYAVVRIILKGPWQSTGIQLVTNTSPKQKERWTLLIAPKILQEYILHSRYVCNLAIFIEEQLLYRKQTSSPSLFGLLIFLLIAPKGQPSNSIVMFDLFLQLAERMTKKKVIHATCSFTNIS